jgi:microcystin-dependent protein
MNLTQVPISMIDASGVDAGKVLTSNGSTLGWQAIVPAGAIISFAGTTTPSGYISCPTSPTNVSRSTYADLFAAIGTTWGNGDGSTTFGIPWFTTGFAMVQTSSHGTIGTSTSGEVKSHSHIQSHSGTGTLTQSPSGGGSAPATSSGVGTQNTGGANNLAAGRYVLFAVKF